MHSVYLQPASKYVSADKLAEGSVGVLLGSKVRTFKRVHAG